MDINPLLLYRERHEHTLRQNADFYNAETGAHYDSTDSTFVNTPGKRNCLLKFYCSMLIYTHTHTKKEGECVFISPLKIRMTDNLRNKVYCWCSHSTSNTSGSVLGRGHVDTLTVRV
jgi:hypothetical protein